MPTIATSHADRARADHYRADASSWHVVDYEPTTGVVRGKVHSPGFFLGFGLGAGAGVGTLWVHGDVP